MVNIQSARTVTYNKCLLWQIQESSMSAVISEQLRVDSLGSIHLQHPQLQPGSLVQVTIRTDSANHLKPQPTFLEALGNARIDAPSDYSIHFQQTLG
jgi:hypothetical protein